MPREFWERPALRAAFANPDRGRRFGAVLRAYHQERRGEVTQAQIAGWLSVSQMHVSRIMRGLCAVNDLENLDCWAQALRIPQRYLWFTLSSQTPDVSTAQAPEPVTVAEANPNLRSQISSDQMKAVARESAEIVRGGSENSEVTLEQLDADVRTLAIEYLSAAPATMFDEARMLRADALTVLERGGRMPDSYKHDLHVVAGMASGILSYATLDLGYAREALTHARSVFHFGELAGHNGLRAWARGTQSLAVRFLGDFRAAYASAKLGTPYATEGTASIRLLSGEAQCLAQLGDAAGAHKALDRALAARDDVNLPDVGAGIFGFPVAKQAYYAGSSLIWLDGQKNAERASSQSCEAIKLFEASEPEDRSLADEALARIYLATARLQLGELDGAVQAYRRVLNLPPDRQISWIVRRLGRIYGMLGSARYRNSRLAQEARDEIVTSKRQDAN
jgi:tetratricopeptide (TPR) repeat protein